MRLTKSTRSGNPCVLGIDIGAGSLKVTVVDANGRDCGSASDGYPTYTLHPGWSEQDPEDWWRALCDAVPRALATAALPASSVRAVAFSAGAHSPVLIDRQGRLVRRAILWNDQRSGIEARELQEKHGGEIQEITLNRPSATWTLVQLLWLVRHEPDAARATHRLMIAKDWLRWRLSNAWHTDLTDAVGTMLWDYKEARWSQHLCELIGWNPETLPPVVQARDVVGAVSREASAECGLAVGTPIVCGTSDTSAEAYGTGANGSNAGVVKLATAATISIIGEVPHVQPGLINYPFAIPGMWYTISATNSCASAHRWLRDRFFMRAGEDGTAAFEEMDKLAAQVTPGSDGMLFHPYLQGERAPYWDPLLRADFVGMTMQHERGHFVRALYEGIAFSLRDVLEDFRKHGLAPDRIRIVGGGARSTLWRQIIADVLQLQVTLPSHTDASYGVALIAGVGAGLFDDERAAVRHAQGERAHCACDPAHAQMYDELYDIYKHTKIQLTDINHRLHVFQEQH